MKSASASGRDRLEDTIQYDATRVRTMSASPAIQSEPQDLVSLTKSAGESAKALVAEATRRVRTRILGTDGRIDAAKLEAQQHAAHGLAWLATYAEAVRELGGLCRAAPGRGPVRRDRGAARPDRRRRVSRPALLRHPDEPGRDGPPDRLARPHRHARSAAYRTDAVETLIAEGNTAENRAALVALMRDGGGAATVGDSGLDEDMEAIRAEMRRFGEAEVEPHAHGWHLQNDYIPMEIVDQMAELGVFGLTIPEEYGGMGLPKISMCVVSEELSRAYIGVGSLGTRSEIAAELILVRRHRGAEAALPAEDRLGRDPADRRLHRAEHRLRPRLAAHPRREGGRRLEDPPATRPGSPIRSAPTS